MRVVGMCSTYKEGRLFRGALAGLLEVELDHLYVFEGPAGEPLTDPGIPATQMPPLDSAPFPVTLHEGRWRTDGRKRNEMLQRAKADHQSIVRAGDGDPGPLWAVVLDADEVLVNGRYLRDRLEWIGWNDAAKGASITLPENPPMVRWPLHLVEHSGAIAVITARVFRADLVKSIDHSSSVVTNAGGIREGWGNFDAVSKLWLERWLQATDEGKLIAWPPLPCEPHIVHRSNLRHPARAGLRMSDQEAVEFARAQAEQEAGFADLEIDVEPSGFDGPSEAL